MGDLDWVTEEEVVELRDWVQNMRFMLRQSFLFFFVLWAFFAAGIDASDAGDMKGVTIGSPAPEWEVQDWINSPPLSLESLRGHVILIRWWTGPGCPFCTASAPYLNDIHRKYKEKGVVVIGFYHHKSAEPLSIRRVKKLSQKMGMEFPLGIDRDWQTFIKYRIDSQDGERWTSVSFLIDQNGLINFIHPGGTITKKDYQDIEKRIVQLLNSGG